MPKFIFSTNYQRLTKNRLFCYFIYQTRKCLLLQGFDFANPENHKFQKKLYLE